MHIDSCVHIYIYTHTHVCMHTHLPCLCVIFIRCVGPVISWHFAPRVVSLSDSSGNSSMQRYVIGIGFCLWMDLTGIGFAKLLLGLLHWAWSQLRGQSCCRLTRWTRKVLRTVSVIPVPCLHDSHARLCTRRAQTFCHAFKG